MSGVGSCDGVGSYGMSDVGSYEYEWCGLVQYE